MTTINVLKSILGVNSAKLISVELDHEKQIMYVDLIPYKSEQHRCPHCSKKLPGYDTLSENRCWRHLDCGSWMVFIRSSVIRVDCPEHGIVTASVPWAEHGSRFTRMFEAEVAYRALHMSKTSVEQSMRIHWKTVGNILSRVKTVLEPDSRIRFTSLKKIGIDETSFKKGHKYLTVVVDHETGQVVWCEVGTGIEVLSQFMEALTKEQREQIEVVTCDGARWIQSCIEQYLPNALRCVDPFHVVQWVTEAMDSVRKSSWRDARAQDKALPKRGKGRPKKGEEPAEKKAPRIKESKYALGKNPENLTVRQQAKLKEIRENEDKLFRAWQMKEKIRELFHQNLSAEELKTHLLGWCNWASRCRIPAMVELGQKIRRHSESIVRTIENGVSNARIEGMNNKIKSLQRRAFGFRNTENLKATVMLGCSNLVDEIRPLHQLLKPGDEMALGEWIDGVLLVQNG